MMPPSVSELSAAVAMPTATFSSSIVPTCGDSMRMMSLAGENIQHLVDDDAKVSGSFIYCSAVVDFGLGSRGGLFGLFQHVVE